MIYRVQVRGVAPGDIRFRTRVKSDSVKEPVMREDSTRVYSDDAAELGPMADRASSASVSGGSWKLCTRRNFGGRCVTINDSVRDFTDIGLNDRVESIRRVR